MTTPRTATPAERFAEKTAELTAAMIDLGHAIVAANARQSAYYAADSHVGHTCGDPRCTIPEHLELRRAEEGRAIIASLKEQNDYLRSLTDRGIDPYAPAGPDLDDLDADQVDADMLGLTQCSQCDWNFLDEEINYGCTDVNQSCFECHEELCTDRTCREEYEDWAADR